MGERLPDQRNEHGHDEQVRDTGDAKAGAWFDREHVIRQWL